MLSLDTMIEMFITKNKNNQGRPECTEVRL